MAAPGRLKFSTVIRYNDFTVRDHQVNGVRTLPGAVYLDLLYRYLQTKGIEPQAVTVQLLFTNPLFLAKGEDRKLVIALDPFEQGWRVAGESFPVTGEEMVDAGATDHFRGEIRRETARISPDRLDIAGLKERALQVSDVAEVYARRSPLGLRHEEGMKLLGRGYRGSDYVLAEVHLGRLAREYTEQFFLHPALLDGAFLIPGSMLADDILTPDQDHMYLPFYLDTFWARQKLPDPCYLYVDESDVSVAPSREVTHINVGIYSADGTLAASVQKFSARRVGTGGARAEVNPAAPPTPAGAPPGVIEQELRALVGRLLGRRPEEVDLEADYYSQGLDSGHLLQLAQDLEARLGRKLYPTLLFEYPNVRTLAAYLAAQEGPAAAAVAPTEPPTTGSEGLAIVGMMQEMTDASFGDYLHTYTAQAQRRQPTPLDVSRPYFLLASNTHPSIFHLMVEPEPGEILEAFVGGSGRPILLLSGFGTTVGQWRRQLVPLARRHQVIALHAPGHGYSVGSRDFSLAGIARSCVKALERLAVDWPVHVVGASWGGMVAQAMAREFPERVASLTLAGSMSNALALSTGDLKEMILADLEQTGSPQDQDIVLNSRFINADLGKYQADAFVTESILPEIMAPTLVLAGERDSVVGTDEARRMSARIPNARYCEITGAGHVPYVTHAAEFTRLVLAFIDEQEAKMAARGGQREQI